MGILVTMDGEQGVRAAPLEDFARAVREAGLEDRVRYLSHGDTYTFVPAPFAEAV